MGKKNRNNGSNNVDEIRSSMSSMEKKRASIADKINQGTASKKEQSEFDNISNNLVQLNERVSQLTPAPTGAGNQDFVEQRTTVLSDPNQLAGGNILPSKNPGPLSINNISVPVETSIPGVESQVPQSGAENIVSSVLGGIDRTGAPTSVDQAINTSIFGGGRQPKKGTQPLIQQGADVSLGLNDPILKGNVSGQVIGNQPIFVGGGDFMAMHVLNNRQKAIQDAANKRAEETQALLSRKPPIVKDQRFQKSLNDQFYKTMEAYQTRAVQEYGEDWDQALKDQSNPLGRGFVQDLANYEFVAGQSDQVADLIGDIDADLESGDQVFSDETLDLRDQYNELQGMFLNGDISGTVNLSDEYNKLKGFTNLDKILTDQDFDVKGTVTQYASILDSDDNYVTTTQKKTAYDDQLRVLAQGLAKGQLRYAVRRGYITQDEIFDRLNARYGYENIVSKKITNKPSAGRSVKVDIDLGGKFEGEKIENIGGTNYNVGQSYELPTKSKPIEISGLSYYDEDGILKQEEGVKSVDLNALQTVQVRNPQTGEFEYKKVATGTTTERKIVGKDSNGNPKYEDQEVTRIYDLDKLGPRLKTDLLKDPTQLDQIFNEMDTFINQNTKKTGAQSALEYLGIGG